MHSITRRHLVVITVCALVSALLAGCASGPGVRDAREMRPPEPRREFRAMWVATVKNIDWPSKPGLSVEDQKKEMFAFLDKAAELRMNTVILQVRTACDALYPSKLEPWSEWLTGASGKAPEPFYDPLGMWVEEAHRRGLQLHAWFNPFRAGLPGRGEQSPDHISKTRPELVKEYGGYLWLDPAEKAAQKQTLDVILDVVRRYDIDGVHIDDYFYPYPAGGADFPDEPSWKRYTNSGGKLSRADWRRDNINRQIRDIYQSIKKTKKAVQFGISPFGIWKPGHPASVKGFNQYESLYADAKLWLNEGWCDYWTPQLYWKIGAPDQPFGDLLKWWMNENTKGRNVWPGLFLTRIDKSEKSWMPQDIVDQIEMIRSTPDAGGHVHFSAVGLTENRKNVSAILAKGVYAEPALVPTAPWLDNRPPGAPRFAVKKGEGNAAEVSWKPRGGEKPWLWAVYAKHGAAWKLHVQPSDSRKITLAPDPVLGPVSAVSVRAVDRSGNQSSVLKAKSPPK